MARGKFGETLRQLIRKRYRSQRDFAAVVGWSEGRVSQLVNGIDDRVGLGVLDTVSSAFSDQGDQDQLFVAYVEDFARSPTHVLSPAAYSTDEEILAYCQGIPDRIAQGDILDVLKATRSLWRGLRYQEKRVESAVAAGTAYAETCFALDRQSEGLRAAAELQSWARERGEPLAVARSSWLMVIGGRVSFGGALDQAEVGFANLTQYLSWWQPAASEERRQRLELVGCSARDGLLVALDLARLDPAAERLLRRRLEVFQSSLDHLVKPSDLSLCKEIESRALIHLGEFDKAHDALTFAQTGPLPEHPSHPIKIHISLGRLYLADGELERAERALYTAKEASESERLLHHHATIVKLLGELGRRS